MALLHSLEQEIRIGGGRSLSRQVEERFDKSLSMSEAVINRGLIDAEALKAFSLANTIFHRTIIQAVSRLSEPCTKRAGQVNENL